MPHRTPFLGLDFDALSLEAAAATIVARARAGAPFVYVATPNVDHLVRLARDPALAPPYADAWLTLCDSRILQLLARASDIALPVAAGSDLTHFLFEHAIAPHDPVAIIGASRMTVDALKLRYGLKAVHWCDAPMDLRRNPAARRAAAEFIRDARARYVFLAVGSPQQEMIAHETLALGGAIGVGLCCGASLTFLSGEAVRAPVWIRRLRLEWLHRLASDPVRLWRRYLVDGPAILSLWTRWRDGERNGHPLRLVPAAPAATEADATLPVRAAG